ncbi:hypothetical protein QYM36_013353, partial [Artemia franciscana]
PTVIMYAKNASPCTLLTQDGELTEASRPMPHVSEVLKPSLQRDIDNAKFLLFFH